MNDDKLITNNPLQEIILDLLKQDQRSLAWTLIDHYFERAKTLEEFEVLGYVSLKAEKRDTYLKCAEYSYSLALTTEQRYNARVNLYKAYNAMNRPEDALFYIEQNLLLTPDDFETQCQKAFNISLMGDKQTAENILTGLCEKFPEKSHLLESAFSGKYLREGKTAQGILSFIETFKPENKFFDIEAHMQRWQGIISPGKKLYVDIEGGFGDQLVNIRFFDRLTSFGMHPILVSQSSKYYNDINQLFRRHGYTVLTDRLLIDRTQLWAPMMSLPGYMRLTESQLWRGPYLKPLRQEKNKLYGIKPKIGIKNSGNPYFAQDEYRKIPIEQIINILPESIDIYFIDKIPHKQSNNRLIDLSDKINSWEDTLDFIDQMDCIVSSCSSIVHAAGAMGKTTFVAVPIAEYYIWTTTKTDGSSPWYGDNFYVARQKKLRDWSDPLQEIKVRVEKLLGTHNE